MHGLSLALVVQMATSFILASLPLTATPLWVNGKPIFMGTQEHAYQLRAQVPPRSESRQEQREGLVREAKKSVYQWCTEPGRSWRSSWPIVLEVKAHNGEWLEFRVTCPDGKLALPKGYSAEDIILFWAWTVVKGLKAQREE